MYFTGWQLGKTVLYNSIGLATADNPEKSFNFLSSTITLNSLNDEPYGSGSSFVSLIKTN